MNDRAREYLQMSSEIKNAIDGIGRAHESFVGKANDRLDSMQDSIEELQSYRDRPSMGRKQSAEVKAFEDWARTGRESKYMSIGGGPADGEALVPEEINDTIIDKALSQGPIANIVRRTQSDTSDYVRLVNLNGQAAAWSSEAGTRSETANFELREIKPTHGEMYSKVQVTNWLLQDSKFDLAGLITDQAARQFARALETSVISGSGTNRPTGMLANNPTTSADDASPRRAQDVLQYVAGTAALADDLIGLYFTLRPEYRQNATFAMSSASLAVVRKLRDSNGSGYLFQENASVAMDAGDGTIVGKRVITSEDLSTIGNSPLVNGVLVGDFEQGYELVQYGGLQIIRDPYSTHGRTTFYIAARFGGRITDNDAIKVLLA